MNKTKEIIITINSSFNEMNKQHHDMLKSEQEDALKVDLLNTLFNYLKRKSLNKDCKKKVMYRDMCIVCTTRFIISMEKMSIN